MANRRTFLSGTGTALLGATGGCLSGTFTNHTQTEYVQYKHILVDVDTSDQYIAERNLLRRVSRQPGEIEGYIAEDHADLVDDDGSVSVPEQRHRSFQNAYSSVCYAVSFCGGDLDSDGETGCRGTNVSWEDFSRFQFGDAVTVDFDVDGDDNVAARVTDVETGSTDGWDIDITTVEFPNGAR